MSNEKKVLVITKRVIFGKEREVLPPDPKTAIPLDDKRLTQSVTNRIVQRGCGVLMFQAEFDNSLQEGAK